MISSPVAESSADWGALPHSYTMQPHHLQGSSSFSLADQNGAPENTLNIHETLGVLIKTHQALFAHPIDMLLNTLYCQIIGTLRGGKGQEGRALYFLKSALFGPYHRS